MTKTHISEALALHQQGDWDAAEAQYHALLRDNPQDAETLYLLGSLRAQRKDWLGALPLLEQACAQQPVKARFVCNLGVVLKELRRFDEARAAYEKALALQPDYAEACNNLGDLCKALGQNDEAIGWFRKAIELAPYYADAHNNLGLTLRENALNNPENSAEDEADMHFREAEKHFRCAMACHPDVAEYHNNLATALRQQKRLEEATASIVYALELRPNFPAARNNQGIIFHEQGQYEAAVAEFHQALAGDPHLGDARLNLGSALQALGRFDEARACFAQLTKEESDRVDSRFNAALLSLLYGDFEQGWAGYEWRLKAPQSPQRAYTQPFWDGSALAGRTLLVHAEQGFGDTFQFIRYLPLIQKDGGRVVFECQPGTKELLQRSQGFDQIVERPAANRTEGGIKHDLQIPLMSLARLFLHPAEQMPGQAPYIHPDPERIELWRQRMADASAAAGASPSSLKVGLIWAGNPKHGNDRNRSMRLADLAPLAQVPGVTLFSLQKGPAEDQAQDAPPGMTLIALGNALTDFADTAGVLANLDVLISVDTSSAHLAGAMGIPIWLMLPFVPDWRWGCAGEQTPWYPSARLFRQPQLRDWANAVSRLTTELERLVVGGALRRIERADALFAAGQFSEAKAVLLPLADGETPHPRALNNLALLYWKEGATAETLRCFERALEIAPSDPTILANCSMIVKTLAEQRPDEQRAR